jgi:hypothetical protein
VIVALLKRARLQQAAGRPLRRLFFVGDTRMSDGTAFANLLQAGAWPGMAFIGSESAAPSSWEMVQVAGQPVYLCNRWSGLEDFDRYCTRQGVAIDDDAAVVLDLDKTSIGARGRNAQVIDQARLEAVYATVQDLLGSDFDQAAFKTIYERLNQAEFHPFTADNQDYLVYICLVLGSGLFPFEKVISEVRSGDLATFEQFILLVERQAKHLPPALAPIHAEIFAYVRAGDPTPFKAFRRNEYKATLSKMGCLDDEAPLEQMLAEEIVLTQEVRQCAQMWIERGALLFGLSDKPDEASIPTPELAAQGWLPIHRQITHAVGAS